MDEINQQWWEEYAKWHPARQASRGMNEQLTGIGVGLGAMGMSQADIMRQQTQQAQQQQYVRSGIGWGAFNDLAHPIYWYANKTTTSTSTASHGGDWYVKYPSHDIPFNIKPLKPKALPCAGCGNVAICICGRNWPAVTAKPRRGRVHRFFNRFRLKAMWCAAMPWRGVKAAARFAWYKFLPINIDMTHPDLVHYTKIPYKNGKPQLGWLVPRWRLWFRDESNGKAKHRLSDDGMWA